MIDGWVYKGFTNINIGYMYNIGKLWMFDICCIELPQDGLSSNENENKGIQLWDFKSARKKRWTAPVWDESGVQLPKTLPAKPRTRGQGGWQQVGRMKQKLLKFGRVYGLVAGANDCRQEEGKARTSNRSWEQNNCDSSDCQLYLSKSAATVRCISVSTSKTTSQPAEGAGRSNRQGGQ